VRSTRKLNRGDSESNPENPDSKTRNETLLRKWGGSEDQDGSTGDIFAQKNGGGKFGGDALDQAEIMMAI
jgi:hypothetical protein